VLIHISDEPDKWNGQKDKSGKLEKLGEVEEDYGRGFVA